MVRSFKKSVQGQTRTHGGIKAGDIRPSNGSSWRVDEVADYGERPDMTPDDFETWSAQYHQFSNGEDPVAGMRAAGLLEQEYGVWLKNMAPGSYNHFARAHEYGDSEHRVLRGPASTVTADFVSGMPNSILREVHVATPQTEVNTEIGQLVRSLNKMQVLGPGRARGKEAQIVGDLMSKYAAPKRNSKEKQPKSADIEDVTGRMSSMHIAGYDAGVQPPWPPTSASARSVRKNMVRTH